ncbi:hypothetical protein D9611_002999 [Ephemerocybe angulata]|nr:hypothetical protein D9611_002999 [Tulosesus angulatus]
MSDLDADLYGDLYGNDETDFTEQGNEEQPQDNTSASDPAPTESSSPSSATLDSKPSQNGTPAAETNGSGYAAQLASAPQPQPATSAIPTYSMQAQQPQKIPTYEQPLPASAPMPRPDSAMQKMALNERSVRPSEMKDEG